MNEVSLYDIIDTRVYIEVLIMVAKASTLEDIRKQSHDILESFNISRASVFGSFASGNVKSRSDVDIIIDTGDTQLGFAFLELKKQLEKKFGRKVDLLTQEAVRVSGLEDKVKNELKVIYEQE